MQKFSYDSNRIYLIAVSGGPDSMALLKMLADLKLKLVVLHVNYHRRKVSNQEQEMVAVYAKEKGYETHVLDTIDLKPKGNFQAWAREIRYDFFKKMYFKYHADGLFVAHHKDDLLETYLMQKSRGNLVSYYGLNSETSIKGMRVIRPLLKYRKFELLNYCKRNQIPYSIDESNNTDDYTRNYIRHHQVSKMTENEIDAMIEEIDNENQKLKKTMQKIEPVLQQDKLMISEIVCLSDEEETRLLFAYITKVLPFISVKLGAKRIREIKRLIRSQKAHAKMLLDPPYYLLKSYDYLSLSKFGDDFHYEFIVEAPRIIDNEYFYLNLTTDTSKINVFDYSYPLIIRTFQPGDVIKFGKIHKSVRRIFINRKIPLDKRKRWPLIVDKNGNIIYIPLQNKVVSNNIENNPIIVVK